MKEELCNQLCIWIFVENWICALCAIDSPWNYRCFCYCTNAQTRRSTIRRPIKIYRKNDAMWNMCVCVCAFFYGKTVKIYRHPDEWPIKCWNLKIIYLNNEKRCYFSIQFLPFLCFSIFPIAICALRCTVLCHIH